MRIRYSIKDNKVDVIYSDGNMEIQDHLGNSRKKLQGSNNFKIVAKG